MPDAPHVHSPLTVWTAQGVSTHALLVTLAVGHRCNDLDRSLDEAFDLGQGLLNEPLERGKGLGRLDSVIAYPLEAFGKHMLHLCGAPNYVARLTQRKILPHFAARPHHIVSDDLRYSEARKAMRS